MRNSSTISAAGRQSVISKPKYQVTRDQVNILKNHLESGKEQTWTRPKKLRRIWVLFLPQAENPVVSLIMHFKMTWVE